VVTEGVAAGQTIQFLAGDSLPVAEAGARPAQSICIAVDAERVRAAFRACFVR
jgi:hypothetical protein